MEQTSKLSIVVDTRNAQSKIREFSTQLKNLDRDGLLFGKNLSKIGASTYFGGLSNSIKTVQDRLSGLEASSEKTRKSIEKLGNGSNFGNLNNSIKTTQDKIVALSSAAKLARSAVDSVAGVKSPFTTAEKGSASLNTSITTLRSNFINLNNTIGLSRGEVSKFGEAALAVKANLVLLGGAATNAKARAGELATSYRQVNTGLQSNAQFLQQANKAMAANSTASVNARLNQDKLAISASKVATAASRASEVSTRAQIALASLAAASSRADAAISGAAAASSRAASANSNAAAAASRAAAAISGEAAAAARAQSALLGVATAQSKLTTASAQAEAAQNKVAASALQTAAAQNRLTASANQVLVSNNRLAISAEQVSTAQYRTVTAATQASIANNRLSASASNSAAAASRAASAVSGEAAARERAAAAASRAAGAASNAAGAALRLAAAEAKAAADADRLAGGLGRVNGQARGVMGTLQTLQGVVMGSIGTLAGFSFLKTADEMQNMNSQIKNVTNSEREYLGVKEKLKGIADQNYNDIKATTGLYASSARALANLGKSQSEALEFTNAVALAMRTGGRSAGEQASAILQLGQAMGANVVQGDEFRSIAENAPILLELVAKRLGVLPGQLKALAADGKITGEVMFDAMTQNVGILEEMAKKMPLTMSQAFQVAKNNYKKYVDGMMNETGGMSSKIAGAISGMSANFDTMAKVSIAGIGLAFLSVVTNVNLATRAMQIFNAVANANPVLLIVGGFLLLTSAIFGTNEVLTISGLVMRDFFDGTKSMLDDAKTWWEQNTNTIKKELGVSSQAIEEANKRNEKSFWSFYKGTETGFSGLVQHIGTNVGSLTAIFGTFFTMMWNWTQNTMSALENVGRGAHNAGSWVREKLGLSDNSVDYVPYANKSLNPLDIYSATYKSNADFWSGKAKSWNQEAGITAPSYKNPLSATSKYGKGFDFNNAFNRNTGQGVLQRQLDGATSNLIAPIGQISNQPMSAEKALQFATMKLMEEREATAKAMEKARKEQEKANRKANGGSKPKDQLVGISGATGNISGPHLDIRYANSTNKVKPEHLARFKADGKPLSAYPMTSGYGNRKAPVKGASTFHAGIDYGMKSGTPITTSVPIKSVKTYASGNGAGNISLVTFTDGVAIKLLHQAPAALKIKNGSRTGNSEYDSAVNSLASDEQKAADEAVKIAQRKYEEMMALQSKLFDEYATEKQKQEKQLAIRLDEIANSGFDNKTKSDMATAAKKQMDSELAVYAEGFNRQLSQLDAFQKTERYMIEEHRKNEKFDATNNKELMRPENEAILKQVLEGIDRKYDHELLVYENTLRKQSSELTAYQKTERQIMLDGWNDKIADASFATDELAQLRIDSLYAQRDKETELFDINQDMKMLELKKSHMTEMQYIREKYALEQYLIDSSNDTPEFKAQQTINNKDGFMKAGQEVQDRVGGAYDAQSRGLYGQSNAYNELKTAWEAQLEIAKAAYDEGYINKEEHLKRMEELDVNYLNNQNALMVSGYATTFGAVSGLLKAFGQEQSFAYKAMFAAEKAFTFASVVLKGYQAVANAYAVAPFPYNIVPVAKALYETGIVSAAVTALSPQGFKTGGYTGSMGVNDIAGVVHGQEYVFDAQATKRIGVDNLNAMRRGDAPKGGGDVIINNYSSAKIEQRQDANGVTILEVRDEIHKSWNQLQNPNSHPSKMVNRNVQAPRRR